MANREDEIYELKRRVLNATNALASQYQGLVADSAIEIDNPLELSRQKIALDVHTRLIDKNARELLEIIRAIKELKVSDDSHHEERCAFEAECESAAEYVQNSLKEAYGVLETLADQGFSVRQNASKLLR